MIPPNRDFVNKIVLDPGDGFVYPDGMDTPTMTLRETERGEVVLDYLDRRFYADDLLPDGNKARDLPGLDADLYQRWIGQKRQRSSGPQYSQDRKVAVGIRVTRKTRDALRMAAQAQNMTVSAFLSEVLEGRILYSPKTGVVWKDVEGGGLEEPMIEEARASVALDKDPNVQTCSDEMLDVHGAMWKEDALKEQLESERPGSGAADYDMGALRVGEYQGDETRPDDSAEEGNEDADAV